MAIPSLAANFSFYATMRAGMPAAADWELGLGRTSNATDSTGQFRWGPGSTFWRAGGLSQNFEIGFRSSTQTAYISVWDSTNTAQTTLFTNTGAPLSSQAIWTLPAASFFASAATVNRPSSINLDNLTLSPGVQVLSGSLPASFGASQPVATTTFPMNSSLVINPASNGGDWYIAGSVRFAGLTTLGGDARRSALQFFLRADGVENPESTTFLMAGVGLLTLCILRKRGQLS